MTCRTLVNVESRSINYKLIIILSFIFTLFINQVSVAQSNTISFNGRIFLTGEKWIPIEVGDKPDHKMGVSEYSGLVFTENGEIATCHEVSNFEHRDGNTFDVGYWIFTFEDSSEMVIKFEGKGSISKNKNPSWRGTYSHITGTGKYLGIQGSGTFHGEYFMKVNCGYNYLSGIFFTERKIQE